MTIKEIKSKYKMTSIGIFWAFLNPLFQVMVMYFVFQYVIPMKTNDYFLFILIGLIPWNFVTASIYKSTTIIVNERSLIQKSDFPKEILVLSIVVANFIHLVLSMVILLAVVPFFGKVLWSWLFLPVILVPLLFIVSGICLILGALNVRFRDVNFLVQLFLPLWFYVTPIVYTINLFPERFRILFYINPLTGVIDILRWSLLQLPVDYLLLEVGSLLFALPILLIGVRLFHKISLHFNEWI